ncbi:MAG TPA: hypothetical protein VKR58_05735 [Aquella sp.]|nr:hypothetical protein [Aquella sp.]
MNKETQTTTVFDTDEHAEIWQKYFDMSFLALVDKCSDAYEQSIKFADNMLKAIKERSKIVKFEVSKLPTGPPYPHETHSYGPWILSTPVSTEPNVTYVCKHKACCAHRTGEMCWSCMCNNTRNSN